MILFFFKLFEIIFYYYKYLNMYAFDILVLIA